MYYKYISPLFPREFLSGIFLGLIVMRRFENFDEFNRNVSRDNLVRIIFKDDLYYDRENFIVNKNNDGNVYPLNYIVGEYSGVLKWDGRKEHLVIYFGGSNYSVVLIPDFKDLIKHYEIFE